jgi:hypothetical protein
MSKRLVFLAALSLAACDGDGNTGPSAGVNTISVSAAAAFGLVGDSVLFTARVIDGNGQVITGAEVQWTSSNAAVATVSSTGYATARGPGTTTITARSGSASASTTFEVDPNPCTAPTAFAQGEVRRYRGAVAFGCATLTAINVNQDFLHIVGNARAQQDDTLTYTYSLSGIGAAAVSPSADYGLRDPRDILQLQGMAQVDDVERRLRAYERGITADALPGVQRTRGAVSRAGAPLAVLAAVADVGDTVTIRVPNLQPGKNICRDFISVRAVVRAVSRRATMMEDLASPSGRLTSTDYQEISKEFDDIIYPTDTLWFGSPTDLNNDQRVSILYTPEVNKLTPANSTGIVGGFFFGGDLIRRSEYPSTNDCRNQTNEQEIFYLLAPDPAATINGNARTTAGVRQVTRGTIAHEFQHMINQSVRQYNPEVKAFEAPWLNEGMSHFAEEAVGRAVSGFSDFQSLRTANVNPSQVNQNDYLAFYRQNLTRFRYWMLRPDTASPTSDRARDGLPSRGAAWALVRYAADQFSGGNARAFFRRLALGPETDITNLVLRTGRPFDEVIGGWLVANYADGLPIPGLDPRYSYTSWDLRDVMSGVNNGVFPLLVNNFPGTFTSQAFSGSGNYYLHRRQAGSGAVTINLRTPGGSPMTSPNARIWVVRLN